ncbi:MAG: hypothetical protein JSR46_06925 [Verrucomicrobia bacterium]|nr:hypothetical protein [Verrucomicrobiota bacterium]
MITQTHQDLELLDKARAVTGHPAWQGSISEQEANALLENQPPMTYLLRQDTSGEFDFWLSHKKDDGNMHHRHFTLRLFPDGWFYANWRATPREGLNDFIQGALVCTE